MKKQKTAQKQYDKNTKKQIMEKREQQTQSKANKKKGKKNKQITTITKQGLKSTITNNREKEKKG